METERKLFEKSLDELRETFVRNRFKQKDVFGRPDIEEWIDAQQKAEDPEYDRATGESYWNAHVLAGYRMRWGASHDPLAVLREYATPHAGSSSSRKPARDLPLEEHPFDADAQIQCIPLLNSFMRAELYYGYRLGVIVVARDRINHPHPYTVRVGAKGLIIASFDQDPERAAVFTMDVLFAEWLYGRSRARWQGARNFLAAGLQLEIRGKRSNAETDFDTAVAVSADGT
ncbi:hypothetical protein HY480_00930, partial [Candidatus Uhrbacteria bacterium]|nr:hypothetical protein [Candidatus Uhrbacteria bacterium]